MNVKLIAGWRNLWRAWSIQAAALGLLLPELLQLVADNTDVLTGFGAGWKSAIRMTALVGVILLRPIRQAALTPAPEGAAK